MSHDELEIERQWILKSLPPKELVTHSVYHEIGYLFDNPGELRVYKKNLPVKGWKYGITVKDDGGITRSEWEDKEFPQWAFNIVYPKTDGKRVYKTRHFINLEVEECFGSHTLLLEIDEYENNLEGLVRLECEFHSERDAKAFLLPVWAEGAIEVTQDARFKNKNLANLSREEYLELINEFAI